MTTFVKFLNPEERTVKWKESWGKPTRDTLLRFLRKVMRNDFVDMKRSKRYQLTSYPEGETRDGEQTMSFDDYAAAIESPEGQAIRTQQREQLLDSFLDEPDLRDVLAVQLDPAGYCAHTNQDLAGLLDTSVPSTFGRESRAEFNEEAAGVRFERATVQAATVDAMGNLLPGITAWARELKEGDAHRGVMNYNFRPTFAKDPALRAPIPKPERYDPSRFALLQNWLRARDAAGQPVKLSQVLDFYPRRNGKFEVNNKPAAIISIGHFGGQFDYPGASYAQREKIVADHWDYTLGLFHFLATHGGVPAALQEEMRSWGLHRQEFADNRHLPYQLYVREARRMKGALIVTQRDVTEDRRKPDAIGMSSHFIDSHHVQRVAVSPEAFVNEGRIWRTSMAYQIPYRALTPNRADSENLLVPGAASFTHVAFCSYRLESVWMIAGHAAGVAAALAAKSRRPVQNVDIAALQDRLRAQRQVVDFIPGQPERWTDIRKDTGGPPVV